MFTKHSLFTVLFCLVAAASAAAENILGDTDPVELYLHGIFSNGAVWEPAVQHRVQTTGYQGLIYLPKGTKEIEVRLYLPGSSSPHTTTLPYKDSQARDQGLRRMDPLRHAALQGFAPRIIAPTMPGEGEFSWKNNTQVVEAWIQGLGDRITPVNILGNSQAGPIALQALARPENHGLVRNMTLIDPAFGSALPALRQTLKGIPEVSGVMPGIGDALKDNAKGSQTLQEVFRSLPGVDKGIHLTVINTKSGVVSQERMIEAVTIMQKTGKQVTVLEDPKLLYKAWQPPQGFGPGANKGFLVTNQLPEFMHKGPHGAGAFQKYANLEVLFQGWTTKPGSLRGGTVPGFEGLPWHWNRDFISNSLRELPGSWHNRLTTPGLFQRLPVLDELAKSRNYLNSLRMQSIMTDSLRRR